MPQEIGESREAWGKGVMQLVEDFAKKTKSDEPYYIVFSAKYDPNTSEQMGRGVFRQAIKAYYHRPPKVLGVLVWYVDKRMGVLDFVPELSCPYDVPLDQELLSDKSEDKLTRVMDQGKNLNVLVS